ncbi:hypothetical protein ACFFRR_002838 [Megaselia abdita]
MTEFLKITEGRLTYRYKNDCYLDYDIKRTYITSIPSKNRNAVFIAWKPKRKSVSLTKDSADSLKEDYFVDLKISIDENVFVFKKQSIFETFRFPDVTYSNCLMKIQCTVFERKDTKLIKNEAFQRRCLTDLSEAFMNILRVDKYTDVVLQCKEGVLKGHKNILASRSPVFDKMFQCGLKETKNNEVNCDFHIDTMKALLQYMYSGKIDKRKVASLFEAADYYEILPLKELCEEVMLSEMNSENAISGLILAHSFEREELKQHILRYIQLNSRTVFSSDDYKRAVKDSSPRMLEITHLIITALSSTISNFTNKGK